MSTTVPIAGPDLFQQARDKIKSFEELADTVTAARAHGKSVVLCHGVFDLVHLGHVRHLEAARREGDFLVVTVTADSFVNKGPGRPVFPEQLRAEMVASIGCVDCVGISSDATAEGAIRKLRPDVFVKGAEYENAEADVTGNITKEVKAVESVGGRIAYTNDLVFSSSTLLNRHFKIYESELEEYLAKARREGMLTRLLALIDCIKNKRVLLVGDAIIDQYDYVDPMDRSAKENIIANNYRTTELFAGGVFAAANHIASFVSQVDIVTTLGGKDSHEDFIRGALKPNVRLNVVVRQGAPTTRKVRFVERAYIRKLFEVYYMDDDPLRVDEQRQIDAMVAERAANADVVIVTDFGHGLIASSTVNVLTRESRFLAVNAQTNGANRGFNLITKYSKADYICIDAPEARLATADRYSPIEDVTGRLLPAAINCGRFIITHGRYGCVAFDSQTGLNRVPAFTKSVVDTVGAGDAFLAVTSPLAASAAGMELVACIGNAAGAMQVGVVGHRVSVDKAALVKFLTALLK
jgi:rfaE bifunctional protein nucleotidyltransferase chain/domain